MTDNTLKSLVTEVSLGREINEKTDRLKELKAELVAEARSRKGELESTDGGSLRCIVADNEGSISRLIFPAARLKAKIHEVGKAFKQIKNLAGAVFARLFGSSVCYEPVKRFREQVAALLPKVDANRLIKLRQGASALRVSLDTTETA